MMNTQRIKTFINELLNLNVNDIILRIISKENKEKYIVGMIFLSIILLIIEHKRYVIFNMIVYTLGCSKYRIKEDSGNKD